MEKGERRKKRVRDLEWRFSVGEDFWVGKQDLSGRKSNSKGVEGRREKGRGQKSSTIFFGLFCDFLGGEHFVGGSHVG